MQKISSVSFILGSVHEHFNLLFDKKNKKIVQMPVIL